jgi:hypothetical protein
MSFKVILIAVVVVAVAFLATWDMPPPTAVTEKVVPNDRYQ